jgi:hypothetical protein
MSASATHDLNGLLGTMKLAAELMQAEIDRGRRVTPAYIESILTAIGRAEGVTRQLMACDSGDYSVPSVSSSYV